MKLILIATAAAFMLGCASRTPPPPAKQTADPMSLLPEKRLTLYFKKGCDDPNEEISEILGVQGDATVLWKAKCADGRVLRCTYHRLLRCRWERKTETATTNE